MDCFGKPTCDSRLGTGNLATYLFFHSKTPLGVAVDGLATTETPGVSSLNPLYVDQAH
jgi:hypothetical protein